MLFYDQQYQLFDVPPTFRRPDATYVQLIGSIAGALTLQTASTSGLLNQTIFQNAEAGWIDVWGDLPGIVRRTGESDNLYSARLSNMLLAARDSAVAILTWLSVVEGVSGTIMENVSTPGYTVTVPATMTPARLQQIVQNLAYVRPAGVPFSFQSRTGGTYLNTVNYFGYTLTPWQGARVTGAFLASTLSQSFLLPPASTDNQLTQLPDLLLTDPTANPNLATPLTTDTI